jgi:L-threonylcarbamoyladenylate synthase
VTTRFDTNDASARARGLNEAAAALRRGHLVGLPVDAHYGLAADAFSERGVAALRAAKGSSTLAIPVLVPRMTTVSGIAVPNFQAQALMRGFWPGSLTLVLPAQPTLAWSLTDRRGRIAVRQPLHPAALDLLERTGPLAVIGAAAPGEDAATAFPDALAEQLAVILDAGVLPGGPPSTVLDLSSDPPQFVREGAISAAELARVVPELGAPGASADPSPRPA